MTVLKQEWDQAQGNLIRNCRICNIEFKPTAWNQTLCLSLDCKEGSFHWAHLQASLKRWETWRNKMKDREEYKEFLKGKQ